MRRTLSTVVALVLTLSLWGCGERSEVAPPPPAASEQPAEPAEPEIPTPPLRESFDKEPQLSLFPRAGGERPDGADSQAQGVWASYIDHLMRLSGVGNGSGRDGSRGWKLASLRGVDSVGFFAPLGVRPNTSYRVSFDFVGDLPKGGEAGIGILEFDQFLWIGEQFTQEMLHKHQTAVYPGLRLTGKHAWASHSFTFTTSARAGMVHLLLFRDGAADRERPVYFDNIVIEAVAAVGR